MGGVPTSIMCSLPPAVPRTAKQNRVLSYTEAKFNYWITRRIGYFVAYYLLISFHLELYESSRVALDGLADVPLDAVELHGPDHPVVLGAEPVNTNHNHNMKNSTDITCSNSWS